MVEYNIATKYLPHVTDLNHALASRVEVDTIQSGMERRTRDDFTELLEVGGLEIDSDECLVGLFDAPEVHLEVVGGEYEFLVLSDRERIDVVVVEAGKDLADTNRVRYDNIYKSISMNV
jgi:hypothetical protein